MPMHPCRECGAQSHLDDQFCGWCGARAPVQRQSRAAAPAGRRAAGARLETSDRRKLVILILWWFLGVFGAHRFYLGHVGLGVAQLVATLACGVGAIWGFVDGLICVIGTPEDAEGRPVTLWT